MTTAVNFNEGVIAKGINFRVVVIVTPIHFSDVAVQNVEERIVVSINVYSNYWIVSQCLYKLLASR